MEDPWIIHLDLRSPGLTCLTTYYRWDPPSISVVHWCLSLYLSKKIQKRLQDEHRDTVGCILLYSGRRLVWQHYGGWKLSGDMAAALWDVGQALGRCGSSSLDAKKKAWHGLYKGETAGNSWSIPIFIHFYSFFMEEWWRMEEWLTRRCEYKRWKNRPWRWNDLVFTNIWTGRWNYQCCGALQTSWLRHIAEESHMELFSIVRPKQATSDEEARKLRHVSSRDAEAMLGPSWMYTTVYRWYTCWYIVDTPHFCWFPILPPDLKKKNRAFFDWTKMRVFPRKNSPLCWELLGCETMKPCHMAVDLDISWHFLTYPTKPGFFLAGARRKPLWIKTSCWNSPAITRHSGKKFWKSLLSPTYHSAMLLFLVLLGVLSMDVARWTSRDLWQS